MAPLHLQGQGIIRVGDHRDLRRALRGPADDVAGDAQPAGETDRRDQPRHHPGEVVIGGQLGVAGAQDLDAVEQGPALRQASGARGTEGEVRGGGVLEDRAHAGDQVLVVADQDAARPGGRDVVHGDVGVREAVLGEHDDRARRALEAVRAGGQAQLAEQQRLRVDARGVGRDPQVGIADVGQEDRARACGGLQLDIAVGHVALGHHEAELELRIADVVDRVDQGQRCRMLTGPGGRRAAHRHRASGGLARALPADELGAGDLQTRVAGGGGGPQLLHLRRDLGVGHVEPEVQVDAELPRREPLGHGQLHVLEHLVQLAPLGLPEQRLGQGQAHGPLVQRIAHGQPDLAIAQLEPVAHGVPVALGVLLEGGLQGLGVLLAGTEQDRQGQVEGRGRLGAGARGEPGGVASGHGEQAQQRHDGRRSQLLQGVQGAARVAVPQRVHAREGLEDRGARSVEDQQRRHRVGDRAQDRGPVHLVLGADPGEHGVVEVQRDELARLVGSEQRRAHGVVPAQVLDLRGAAGDPMVSEAEPSRMSQLLLRPRLPEPPS